MRKCHVFYSSDTFVNSSCGYALSQKRSQSWPGRWTMFAIWSIPAIPFIFAGQPGCKKKENTIHYKDLAWLLCHQYTVLTGQFHPSAREHAGGIDASVGSKRVVNGCATWKKHALHSQWRTCNTFWGGNGFPHLRSTYYIICIIFS